MYEQKRIELVALLEEKGILDNFVLKAFKNVEREKFIPTPLRMNAYKDIALPIGYGQTISQPYTIAIMTQSLNVKKNDRVLEIGTGSGYQAAILRTMGAFVYTIERHFEIYNQAQRLFDKLGFRVHCKLGDGTIGWEEYSPYDGIIVTAGAPEVPPTLKKQLAVGGNLVIPVGDKKSQRMYVIKKLADDKFETEEIREFSFVPLVGREGWKEEY
jgi:protein-L-isoaspartate(D-aspartate) O-methyltransferase